MKRRLKGVVMVTTILATLAATMFPAYAAGIQIGNDPAWFDEDRELRVGNGPVFSELHPELTDPEHYIKERYMYPGEEGSIPIGKWAFDTIEYKSFKTPYENEFNTAMKEALPLLQEFVHSFDWINSDERTRYEKVYERLGNNYNGNVYGTPTERGNWTLLRNKKGVCQQYADEFAELCRIVGLDCVSYNTTLQDQPHADCLIKIDGQWYKVDPTNWPKEKTVAIDDFDAEYNRSYNEMLESDWYKKQREEIDRIDTLTKRWEAGELTEEEYWRLVYPNLSEEKIQEITAWDGYVDGLGN